jgi:DNA-binding NtrC family response regulator
MQKFTAALIVDDDLDVLRAARVALAGHFESISTVSAIGTLDAALSPDLDVVLLDMNFAPGQYSGQVGLGALARIRARDPALSVVHMTGFGSVALAVEALKQGAADFVLKPWRNDKLVAVVCAAAERTRAARRGDTLDLDTIERRAIERALAEHGGNISAAATALGLSRPALYRRMEKHRLQG